MGVRIYSILFTVLLTVLLPSGFVAGVRLSAAEPEFVGILALVADEEVTAELELAPEQKAKLRELIDAREADAVDLAMQLKDKPAEERTAKLEAFRRESEAKGLMLLTSEQRAKLEKIRLGRMGMASLAEPDVVGKLQLTKEQQQKIADLLKRRDQDLARADEKKAYSIRMESERQLAAVLNPQQKTAWEGLVADNSPNSTASHPQTSNLKPQSSSVGAEDGPARSASNPSPPSPIPNSPSPVPNSPPEGGGVLPSTEQPVAQRADKIRFNARFTPWKQILEWFAEKAGYSLIINSTPPGTFNYYSNQEYTPAEAIDLLNWQLLTKGYTLIRRGDQLMLINLADGIPPEMVDVITPDKLDERGEYELVSVVFNLEKLSPEDAEQEIHKMIGPQGSVVALPKSRQVQVTDTGGRLRAIRDMIQRVEDPQGVASNQIKVIELKYTTPEAVMPVIRQLLDLPEDQNAATDGSLRIVPDSAGRRLLVSGKLEKLKRLEEVLKVVDAPRPGAEGAGSLLDTPQLEVYSIVGADAQSALAVMQTLLAGSPDVRLALDPKTGNLVALARPSQQATIRATLDQMQRDARRVEVIRLRALDPQLAVLAINKLFGGDSAKGAAPQIDADPNSRQLMIRGTEGQIQQIRDLLIKLGETGNNQSPEAERGNVRMLTLSPRAVSAVLGRLEEIWPSVRSNKIRVVTPSAASSSMRMSSPALRAKVPTSIPQRGVEHRSEEETPGRPWERFRRWREDFRPPWGFPPGSPGPPGPPGPTPGNEDHSTQVRRPPIWFVAEREVIPGDSSIKPQPSVAPDSGVSQEAKNSSPPNPLPKIEETKDITPPVGGEKKTEGTPPPAGAQTPPSAKEPPPIVLSFTPGGVIIASDDLEALDEFEKLLDALAGGATAGGPELTIFYLKNASAAAVAETLDQIFGGGTLTQNASSGRGGSMLGDLAGAALGDAGGGIVGSLLGLGGDGGAIQASGMIRITPDTRLNALIVQANPLDLDTVDQLLKILDQKDSPEEILVAPKARMIPVVNTKAETIAEILKQVYQDRLVSAGGGANRPPTPQEFFMMLRGRGGRGNAAGAATTRGATEEPQKMSIGVDSRTNSLVIAAPDSLFQEVKDLVAKLDVASEDSTETMQVVALRSASPEAVQRALSALAGEGVQIGRSGGATSGGSRSQFSSDRRGQFPQSMSDFQRRRMEFFRSLREGGGGGGRGGRGG